MRRGRILVAAAVLVPVSGCSTFSGAPHSPEARPAPAQPAAATRGGGYYLDDGPHAKPPANLEAVPDAVPRAEPLHRGAQRPYVVMGRNYVPMTALVPYRARGVASWYGRRYHGKLTSNGETYDMYAMSAAHPTLPLPSFVRVTSVANGKSVIVRVNDRGPFIDSRLIDLSYTAAYKLGIIKGGSALVDVELIQPGASDTAVTAAPAAASAAVATAPSGATPPAAPATPVKANAAAAEAIASVPAERTMPLAAERSGVYLQLAAFGSKENADAYASRLRADVDWLAGQLHVLARDGLFRVRAGPYASPDNARQTAQRISQLVGVKPVVQPQ